MFPGLVLQTDVSIFIVIEIYSEKALAELDNQKKSFNLYCNRNLFRVTMRYYQKPNTAIRVSIFIVIEIYSELVMHQYQAQYDRFNLYCNRNLFRVTVVHTNAKTHKVSIFIVIEIYSESHSNRTWTGPWFQSLL